MNAHHFEMNKKLIKLPIKVWHNLKLIGFEWCVIEFQTSKINAEDHGNSDEDASDTTPMMQQSDNTSLIDHSQNDGRLQALKQRFRYCDYCEIEVLYRILWYIYYITSPKIYDITTTYSTNTMINVHLNNNHLLFKHVL